MIQISDKSQCCGCTACYSICPKDAITMQPDAMGFLYPVVDHSKCVDCGLCEKVCAFNANYDTALNLPEPLAYAARHKDMREVETSRSGAAFVAISDYVLENGGVVYGAGFVGHFRVVHKRAVTVDERNEFKGSKYVQSDLGDVFRQIRHDLRDGRLVLFSGTPCQTSGLNSYIGEKLRANLYLVDIVCHGVPGPYIWRDYLHYLERKYNAEICQVNFRNKRDFGWSAHLETYSFSDKTEHIAKTFTSMFLQHINCRKSCSVCPFTNLRRPSDVTIADYWGWEKTDVDFNKDNKGVSLVLVNTLRGNSLFENVKSALNVIPAKLENCLQPNLQHTFAENPRRDSFEKYYAEYGLEKALKRFGFIGVRYKLKVLRRKFNTAKRLLLKKL